MLHRLNRSRPTLVLAALLLCPGLARADGCIFGKGARFIPEKEQHALIEWREGQERLFVATRSEASAAPSLWIVPVPAAPAGVQAEPVATFPRVVLTESVTRPALKKLQQVREELLIFGSGFPLIAVLDVGGVAASKTFGMTGDKIGGVEVHQHLEKLGMVVEVLTAQSAEALDRYLADKQFDTKTAQLPSLASYIQKDFTLICAWAAAPGKPLEARALRIDFPSADVFYPLLPTRAYTTEVATAVFVRGWARLPAEAQGSGARCEYVRGRVVETSVVGQGTKDLLAAEGLAPWLKDATDGEPLTRVVLPPSPQAWTQDLRLEPKAPTAIVVAEAVNHLGEWLVMLLPASTGLVLASFLPFVLFPPGRRRVVDWFWAGFVGVSAGLSIFGSVVVFYVWCRWRRPVEETPPLGNGGVVVLWVTALSFGILLMGTQLFPEKDVWLMLAIVVACVLPAAAFYLIRSAAAGRGAWLVVFGELNLLADILLVFVAQRWLAGYP